MNNDVLFNISLHWNIFCPHSVCNAKQNEFLSFVSLKTSSFFRCCWLVDRESTLKRKQKNTLNPICLSLSQWFAAFLFFSFRLFCFFLLFFSELTLIILSRIHNYLTSIRVHYTNVNKGTNRKKKRKKNITNQQQQQQQKQKKMSHDLGYDLEEALQRRSDRISLKSIQALRVAVGDSKLVPKNITDKLLALFLDASNGRIDVAKKTCEIYYDAKKHAPEHFSLRDPKCSEIQQCLENQWVH